MRKMFNLVTFKKKEQAIEYIKTRKLRKYNLNYNSFEKIWTISHSIYL